MAAMKRIYLAGPMTGLPNFNFDEFQRVATILRSEGYIVASPHESDGSTDKSWEYYMCLAVAQLVTCDTVILLPGWRLSRGAQLECMLAEQLSIPTLEWSEHERR